MLTVFTRTEPEAHLDRWYIVTVQPTLLDEAAVIYAYGNRQTEWQQIRILPADSMEEARETAEKIVAAKIERGYTVRLRDNDDYPGPGILGQ